MKPWPVARLLMLLVPIALVGIFGRVYYTPDEPREASLVMAMSAQAQKAMPELAGRSFAEKPPLLYWLGGASVGVFGHSPGAARVPNLLYLLVSALAIGALVARAAGGAAGFAAGLVTATMLQLYEVLVWLATDAPLVAGVAVALLGAYVGLTAEESRERLRGYLLFHLGLAIAFFAKGFAGWMVPLFAFLTVVVSERRWRDLRSRELWAGVPLLALLFGAWVLWVAARPDGVASLKVLFWYNLVGRVVALDTPAQFAYATGHVNSPAKYLLELPLYLLPWTALAVAALRRVRRGASRSDAEGTAWRLALGAIVPATVLLSLAATARGVYYGPPALGFAILIGLYVGGAGTAVDRGDRLAWRITGVLVAGLALLLGAAAAMTNFAPTGRTGLSLTLGTVAVLAALVAAGLALTSRRTAADVLPRQALAVTLVLTLVAGPLYGRLNDLLSLETLAGRVAAAVGDRPLLLLQPDETTVALTALYLPGAHPAVAYDDAGALADARAAVDSGARVLWLVPSAGHWRLRDWLGHLGYAALERPAAPAPPPLPEGLGLLRTDCVLERAGGRMLAVLAARNAPPTPEAVCR